jgi:hypothetical protein
MLNITSPDGLSGVAVLFAVAVWVLLPDERFALADFPEDGLVAQAASRKQRVRAGMLR